jgi:hypothetical protein
VVVRLLGDPDQRLLRRRAGEPHGGVVFGILLGLARASTKAGAEASAAHEVEETHDPTLQRAQEPAMH